MKLSIVIPAYNEAANIGKCLDELERALCAEGDIRYEMVSGLTVLYASVLDGDLDPLNSDPCDL